MDSKNMNDVDGFEDNELSPDFEEFDGNYFEMETDSDSDEIEDEDSEYCKETQDDEFYIDSDSEELTF